MTVKQLEKQIRKQMAAIAAHRDALRDLISEAESIEEDANEAVDCLESAADYLSRNL